MTVLEFGAGKDGAEKIRSIQASELALGRRPPPNRIWWARRRGGMMGHDDAVVGHGDSAFFGVGESVRPLR